MDRKTVAKSPKYPRVSVVISNYNGMKLNLLTESLGEVLKNDYPNLEVLVVDNDSTDHSVAAIKQQFGQNKRLVLLQNPVNMYSQGLNLGLKRSSGEYVAFFNNDVVVDDGYFQKFVGYFEDNPQVGLAQGKLLSYFDHQVIDSAGETMDEYGNPITIGAGLKAKTHFNQAAEVLSVSGSCSMVRKSILAEVGKFDADYGIGYEDLDLALRVWMAGYKVMFYPGVVAYHKRGATDSAPMVKVKVRWHFNKNRFVTLLKNYPVSFLIRNLPVTMGIYTVAGLWEIFRKGKIRVGLTRFSAMWWVMMNWDQIMAKRAKVQAKLTAESRLKIRELLYQKTLSQSIQSFLKVK